MITPSFMAPFGQWSSNPVQVGRVIPARAGTNRAAATTARIATRARTTATTPPKYSGVDDWEVYIRPPCLPAALAAYDAIWIACYGTCQLLGGGGCPAPCDALLARFVGWNGL